MSMKIQTKFTFMIVFVLFIFGCKPSMDYQAIIYNQTKDTIYFDFDRKYGFYPDGNIHTTVCIPNFQTIYFSYDIDVGASCPHNPVLNKPIAIRTSGNKTLKKDFIIVENWDCEIIKNKLLKLTFIINEEDLE